MKAKRFEELIIWQKARGLTKFVYQLTNKKGVVDLSLKDQMRRAAVSVLSNIAEGFERGTKEELLHFLYIARASCGEVRAQSYVALDQNYINQKDFKDLKNRTEFTSRLIYRFIESVKVSQFKGLKHKRNQKINDDEWLKNICPKSFKLFYTSCTLKHPTN